MDLANHEKNTSSQAGSKMRTSDGYKTFEGYMNWVRPQLN